MIEKELINNLPILLIIAIIYHQEIGFLPSSNTIY